MAAPASARPDPGNGSQSEWSCQTNCYTGPNSTGGGPDVSGSLTNPNGIEFLQLGAGVLAGVALAGAGVALVSRRHHHAPHPV